MANLARVLIALAVFTPATACVIAAAYLASNQLDGWGWFLFVAVLIGGSVRYGDKGDENE